MQTTASSNPFDPPTILDGIGRWVEMETPTEAPEQVNLLASLQIYLSSIEPRARLLHRLYQTLR